jgi:hypothetical protein
LPVLGSQVPGTATQVSSRSDARDPRTTTSTLIAVASAAQQVMAILVRNQPFDGWPGSRRGGEPDEPDASPAQRCAINVSSGGYPFAALSTALP